MKEVTLVVGSMRHGNSEFISSKIVERFPFVRSFQLGEGIQYCTGCLKCDDTHSCVISDNMEPILDSIIKSELLVIVTPVRYSLMSGDVKVFIDRLNPTAVSEKIKGKKVFTIAVGQTEEEDGTVQEAIKSIEMFAENAELEFIGGIPVFGCYGETDLMGDENIVDSILNKIGEMVL